MPRTFVYSLDGGLTYLPLPNHGLIVCMRDSSYIREEERGKAPELPLHRESVDIGLHINEEGIYETLRTADPPNLAENVEHITDSEQVTWDEIYNWLTR